MAPRNIPGDPNDPRGFVVAILDYCESLLSRHDSVRTVESHERHLAQLAGWLLERSVSRPSQVTRPMLQRYQRWLFWSPAGQPQADLDDFPGRPRRRGPVRQNRVLDNPAATWTGRVTPRPCPASS